MRHIFVAAIFSVLSVAMTFDAHGQETLAEGQISVGGRIVTTLEQAFNAVEQGGTIRIGPGTYKMAGILKNKHGVSIYGSLGTVFDGVAAGGKATFVLASNDITMEDITCRNVKVRDKNGACIRFEGTNLILRRVQFENSENGLLANKNSGNILIEDSIFDGNGAGGRSHGMYVNGGRLTVRRTKVINTKGEGHGIKSRAEQTIIEDSIIASLNGKDSRLIDIPNGGIAAIRRNLLVEGPNTANWQLLSFGVEKNKHESHFLKLEDNVIITDRDGGSDLILVGDGMPTPTVRKNVVVGNIRYDWPASNFFFDNRSELGLPPAPELPAWDPSEDNQ